MYPPLLTHSAAPISESTSWNDSVKMEHVPTGVIATYTVAREPVQAAVRLNYFWWVQSGFLNGRAELLNRARFNRYPLEGRPGVGITGWGEGHLASPSIICTSQNFIRSTCSRPARASAGRRMYSVSRRYRKPRSPDGVSWDGDDVTFLVL